MQEPDGFEDKTRGLLRVDVLHVPEEEGEQHNLHGKRPSPRHTVSKAASGWQKRSDYEVPWPIT